MREFDGDRLVTLAAVADHLIPEAHGMPSAGVVVDANRLAFVLGARPDLREPLATALRPDLGADPAQRLAVLERDEPGNLGALQLVIVGAYYTDKRVKELIGYNGQEAIEVKSWLVPQYIDEGLIDKVLANGPVWRDPDTGQRAQVPDAPRTYAERFAATKPNEEG